MKSQIIDNDYNFPIHLFYKGWYVVLDWETESFWGNAKISANFHIPIDAFADIYAYASEYEKDLSKLYHGTQPHYSGPSWYRVFHNIGFYSYAYNSAKIVASTIASKKKQPPIYRFQIEGSVLKKLTLVGSADIKDEAIRKVENYIDNNLCDIWSEFRSAVLSRSY